LLILIEGRKGSLSYVVDRKKENEPSRKKSAFLREGKGALITMRTPARGSGELVSPCRKWTGISGREGGRCLETRSTHGLSERGTLHTAKPKGGGRGNGDWEGVVRLRLGGEGEGRGTMRPGGG